MAIGRIGSGCSANIELFDIKYLCWLCHAIFEECWKTLDPIRSSPRLFPYVTNPLSTFSSPSLSLPLTLTTLSVHVVLHPFLCIDEFSVEALSHFRRWLWSAPHQSPTFFRWNLRRTAIRRIFWSDCSPREKRSFVRYASHRSDCNRRMEETLWQARAFASKNRPYLSNVYWMKHRDSIRSSCCTRARSSYLMWN